MAIAIKTNESVTVQSCSGLREQLASAFLTGGDVTLDASLLREADLSFLQIVEAARQQARRDGKRFSLAYPANADVADLLARAGFTAAFTPDDNDFWFHGDLPR